MLNLIKPAHAVSLGPIEGTGKFQTGLDAYEGLTNNLLSTLITTLTVVGALAFVMYFTLGGLKWISSSGDKGKTEEASTQMTQAALGLIVIVVSYFIVGIVGGVLGIDILNPMKILLQGSKP